MKLPRWALITAWALVLLLIVAVGIWWLTAPYQTAVRFRAMLVDGQFQRANQLLANGEWRDEEHGFIILDSPVNTVSLSQKDWQASVKDAELPSRFGTLHELLIGTRRVVAKTRFGTVGFTARVNSVSYDGILDRGKASWGLSAGASSSGPPAISGGYSCPDPNGASISVSLNDEEIPPIRAHFGSGVFTLVGDSSGENLAWVVKLVDVDGTVKKQLSVTMVASGAAGRTPSPLAR